MKKSTNNKPSSYQILKSEHQNLLKEFEKASNVSNKPIKGKAKPISSSIPIIQTLYRVRTDISTWRAALQYAEQVQYPNRLELYRLYKEIILDAHLSSLIDIRKAYSLSAEYVVTRNGVEVPELAEKLHAKWFYDFINLALDSIFFGFSLIEFSDIDPTTKEFNCLELVPREYVKPEFGIVGATTSSIEGESWLEKPWSNWSIGIGDKTNLGLLAKAAPYVLWKRGSQMAQAEYAEMFGTPIRIMKTDSFDEETRQAAENFMRNMATSAYAVIGKEDEIDLISDKNASGVEVMFNGLSKMMNEELSKLIVGGTGVLDEKSFVGSAKIHQDNFELITRKDRIFLENIFKYQLVPFLNLHGFGLEGCKIECAADDDLTLLEQFQIESSLLSFGYEIEASYLNEKYGLEVKDKPAVVPGAEPVEPFKPIKVAPPSKLIK